MVEPHHENILVEQSLQGDHAAFEDLIRKYQRMIHSLAYRMTGSLDEADDLVQETFIQAYRRLESFRSEARFSSWLYRIALNLCLNWQNRQKRRSRAYEQWEPQESSASDGRLDQDVQTALLKLSPEQRAAVILTVYDGLNHAEAARALGCSETTISWRVFAARRKLKRWLKPHIRQA